MASKSKQQGDSGEDLLRANHLQQGFLIGEASSYTAGYDAHTRLGTTYGRAAREARNHLR